jgi:cytohesin
MNVNVVLYSRKSSTWKLADFGISTQGSTSHAITTKDSRGSIGYRASELLADHKAVYTNKIDIWSMGCVLYELAAGKQAFRTDLAVYGYCMGGKDFDVVLDEETFHDDGPSKSRIEKTIVSSLQIEPSLRPSASDLWEEFNHYSQPTHVRLQYVQIHNGRSSSLSGVEDLDGAGSIAMDPLAKREHFSGRNAMADIKEDVDALDKDREAASQQDARIGRIRGSVGKIVHNKVVNARDENGMTELHFAAARGHVDAIKALKEAGGDVSATDNDGLTPMHQAARNGHVEAIKALKEAGGDVSAKDNNGEMPMHQAAWNGHDDAIKALKEAGGDVSAKARFGLTPMHRAVQNGQVEAIKALKEAGGDVSAKDNNGDTPMHHAAWNGHVEAIKALKEAGGDVSAMDNDGLTPMHCAAYNGHVEAIKALKEAGGDVSAKNNRFGSTPMHRASQNGHVEAIKVLKEAGGDFSAKDYISATPMNRAAWGGHVEAIEALKETGGNVRGKNSSGTTPKTVAGWG